MSRVRWLRKVIERSPCFEGSLVPLIVEALMTKIQEELTFELEGINEHFRRQGVKFSQPINLIDHGFLNRQPAHSAKHDEIQHAEDLGRRIKRLKTSFRELGGL